MHRSMRSLAPKEEVRVRSGFQQFRLSSDGQATDGVAMQSTRRKAFTLIELLVTLGVIGLLAALLLPGVQRTREAARRVHCQNNLRQIGLAFHGFHETHRGLPPMDLGDNWATWAVLILPYVERNNLYGEWDVDRQYYVQPKTAGADLGLFHCPSRLTAGRSNETGDMSFFQGFGLEVGPPGWSDYAAVWGTKRNLRDGPILRAVDSSTGRRAAPPRERPDARFSGWEPATGFRSLAADGVSNTIILGEKHLYPGSADTSVFNGDHQSGYMRVCGFENPLVGDPAYKEPDWSSRFGSAHRTICHFVLADGSVRAVNADIDAATLNALAKVGEGAVVGDF